MNPGPSRKQLKYGALKCYADFLLGEKVPRFQDQDSHAIRNWLWTVPFKCIVQTWRSTTLISKFTLCCEEEHLVCIWTDLALDKSSYVLAQRCTRIHSCLFIGPTFQMSWPRSLAPAHSRFASRYDSATGSYFNSQIIVMPMPVATCLTVTGETWQDDDARLFKWLGLSASFSRLLRLRLSSYWGWGCASITVADRASSLAGSMPLYALPLPGPDRDRAAMIRNGRDSDSESVDRTVTVTVTVTLWRNRDSDSVSGGTAAPPGGSSHGPTGSLPGRTSE